VVDQVDAPFGFQGFLGYMAAIQLCAIKQTNQNDGIYTRTSIHRKLKVRAKDVFIKFVNEHYVQDSDERKNG